MRLGLVYSGDENSKRKSIDKIYEQLVLLQWVKNVYFLFTENQNHSHLRNYPIDYDGYCFASHSKKKANFVIEDMNKGTAEVFAKLHLGQFIPA